ncbi:hypothetical protein PG630_09845 [Riemerella anatipestifer]|nr:hypothetical protein [Riemerella anatipestifer]
MKTKTTKLSVCAFLGLGLVVYGQNNGRVGINTPNPKATLEISKDGTDTAKGIIIPRLTAEEVKAMTDAGNIGTEQHSLLVYVTGPFANTLDRVGKYELISGKGYYYWDNQLTGGKWKKILDADNFYTAGTGINLSGNTFSRTGLEAFTENGKTGWRLIGRTQEQAFGDTGVDAVTLTSAREHQAVANFGSVGDYSFSTGFRNSAAGGASTAMGSYSEALASNSVAIGNYVRANGVNAIALGKSIDAIGTGSIAIGTGLTIKNDNEIGLGYRNFNTDTTAGVTDTHQLFSIGNGSLSKRGNALVVLRNGYTGFGLTTDETTPSNSKPTEMLDVNGKIRLRLTTKGSCSDANRGAIVYDSDDNFYGCKSTGWVKLNP